jgi:hypothetical protein
MWATLAIASALSLAPAQAGKLEIKNDRPTYGILGQERKESKLLAGDIYVVTFDIEGLKPKDDGRIKYSMAMELVNSKDGKQVFKREAEDLEATNALGGSRLPAFALAEIGTETAAGEYTMNVTVTDLVDAAKSKATLTRKFEVVPKKFGFARVALGSNADGQPAPAVAVTGQTYFLNFALVGFDLDEKSMQPDLAVEMRIFDKDGKPTQAKPFTGEANKGVPAQYRKIVPMQFVLALNRPGDFTIEMEATDKYTKKTVKQSLKITVLELPK